MEKSAIGEESLTGENWQLIKTMVRCDFLKSPPVLCLLSFR